MHLSRVAHRVLSNAALCAYKVILHPQSLGTILLQEPLKQLPPRVGHVGFEDRNLVQDVVVHLGCVATVEGRLRNAKGRVKRFVSSNPYMGKVGTIP